jgi:hypothetical protein
MALSLNGSTGISGINGSAGTPALQGGDADTGIFFGTDTASIATAGTNRLHVTSTGLIGVGTSVPAGSLHVDAASGIDGPIFDSGGAANANHALLVRDSSNNQLLRVNNNGNTGIGTQSPAAILHLNSSTSTTQRIQSSLSDGYNTIHFVNDTSQNGYVWQNGSGVTSYGGANALNIADYSGPIVFSASTTGAYVERMRLLPTGGLTFNGDTAQANALDDYEEGTFTPDVRGTTTVGSASYSHRHGQYVKVGHLVHIQIYLVWSGGTGAGDLQIHNLPFISNSVNTAYIGVATGYWHNVALSTNHYPQLFVSYNNNFIFCYQAPLGGGSASPVPYAATGGGIIVGATYRAV